MIKGSFVLMKLFRVSCDTDKFSNYRFCENEGLMLLIFNVTSRDHNLKGLCAIQLKDFIVASLSQKIINIPCLLVIGIVQIEI